MSSNRDIWVNRCRQKIQSRFSLAQAAVLRWEQLLRGARPRITTENPKWMETPLREIASEAVALDREEFAVKLAGTPYEPPRPEPGDELDDLLGGVLGDLEDEATTEEAAEAKPEGEAAPAADGTPEEPATDEEPVAAAVDSGADSDADADADADAGGEGEATDDDKEKTETQTGDAA
jgi:DNA-directed RNA polymerase subunit K/omega